MSALGETAAVYSFASLAADWALRPENWPAFLAWCNEMEDGQVFTDADRPHAEHLAMHMSDWARRACALHDQAEQARLS